MYRNAKKLLKLFVLLLFLFTSHIVKVHTFLYKIGQSIDTLTADKTCMQRRTGGSTCETAANEAAPHIKQGRVEHGRSQMLGSK